MSASSPSARHRAFRVSPRLRLRGRVAATLALTALVVASAASSALASGVDESIVDTSAPTGSVTLAPGESGSIAISLTVTGNQVGTATFDVYRDWTLSGGIFSGSNPQTFTVPARSAQDAATTFNTTGSVAVDAAQADGSFTLAVGAFNITNDNQQGAKLAVGRLSSYAVTVHTSAVTDTTAPVITPHISGTLGNGGWYTSDVTLTWDVTDAESTVSSTSGCDETVITADQQATDYTCYATSAGGSGHETVSIKRDATDPIVSLVGGPADGGSYYFGFVPTAPTCDASDATSGLDGACSVTGYDATVGSHTVTASAFDMAGNEGTDSAVYDVLVWTLHGFYAPVDMNGVLNTVKGGSTVPLKFQIFAGDTELTDVADVASFSTKRIDCESTEGIMDAIEVTSTGGTSLRYDTSAGQFVQNWKTPKTAGACYAATMTALDGSELTALFKIK